ncbi:MAG: hypothetical protein ACREBI_07460 [Nitrosotalea sp.]
MILPILSTHFNFYWCLLYHTVRVGIPLIGIGAIIIAFGILFFLQGNSIVGPHSSFMYSNPKWIVNGEVIAAAGMGIVVFGVGISLRRPRS